MRVHTWKEIGQGYGDGEQVPGTREAQDVNYGVAAPGLRAGDIPAFTRRFRNRPGHAVGAALERNFDGELAVSVPAAALGPGDRALHFTPAYTVTAVDVAQALAGALRGGWPRARLAVQLPDGRRDRCCHRGVRGLVVGVGENPSSRYPAERFS